jgi:integrase
MERAGRNRINSRTLRPRAVDGFKEKALKRRRHQDGQLIKCKDGFAVRFYENTDGERKRVQKFLGDFRELPTLRAAKNAMQLELTRVNQTVSVQRNTTLTFRNAATEWLRESSERKQRPIKPSVACTYRGNLRNHLNPLIGELPIEDCRSRTMRSVVDRLHKKGLAPQTIHCIVTVAKLIIGSVCDEDGNQLYNTKWNKKFLDMPEVDRQNTPVFTTEQVSNIVSAASDRFQMAAILLASTGLRIGELVGLEVRHFNGHSLQVEQAVWNQKICSPKTKNAYRTIELAPPVASLLRSYIGERTSGFILRSCSRKPITPVNLLVRDLHPVLENLKIPRCGFHAFRRFRATFLRRSSCPESLLKYWLGHSRKQDMTDRYDKSWEDVQYRQDVSKAMGVGFTLPDKLTPIAVSDVRGRLPVSTETLENAVCIG